VHDAVHAPLANHIVGRKHENVFLNSQAFGLGPYWRCPGILQLWQHFRLVALDLDSGIFSQRPIKPVMDLFGGDVLSRLSSDADLVEAAEAAFGECQMIKRVTVSPNKRVESNRRPARPLDAEGKFGSASWAPSSLSAAVAHPFRSARWRV
jgi:hypothetical protein